MDVSSWHIWLLEVWSLFPNIYIGFPDFCWPSTKLHTLHLVVQILAQWSMLPVTFGTTGVHHLCNATQGNHNLQACCELERFSKRKDFVSWNKVKFDAWDEIFDTSQSRFFEQEKKRSVPYGSLPSTQKSPWLPRQETFGRSISWACTLASSLGPQYPQWLDALRHKRYLLSLEDPDLSMYIIGYTIDMIWCDVIWCGICIYIYI